VAESGFVSTDVALGMESGDAVVKDSHPGTASGDTKPEQTKMITWNQVYVVWLPPEAVVRLRERIIAKMPLEAEVGLSLHFDKHRLTVLKQTAITVFSRISIQVCALD
jgi:hypothetical protein